MSADDENRIDIAERGGWTVVKPREASLMDQSRIDAVQAKIVELVAAGHAQLVLNFSAVEYISSSLVGTLLTARQVTQAAGGNVVLAGLNDRLTQVLKIVRLDTMFTIEPDARTALKKLGAI